MPAKTLMSTSISIANLVDLCGRPVSSISAMRVAMALWVNQTLIHNTKRGLDKVSLVCV